MVSSKIYRSNFNISYFEALIRKYVSEMNAKFLCKRTKKDKKRFLVN